MAHWTLESEVDPQHPTRDRHWIASSNNPERALATALTKAHGELLVNYANSHAVLVAALEALEKGFADGSIKFTNPRQSDSDPYHPANTLMCAALADARS